jgi:hypothetical protein
MAKADPGRWVVIDAGRDFLAVQTLLRGEIEGRLVLDGLIERGRLGRER